MRARERRFPLWQSAVVLSLLAVVGGCVYLRLLKTKDQLIEFDRYFDTRLEEGALVFEFLEPHLTTGDMRKLGFISHEERQEGESTFWKVGMEGVDTSGNDPAPFDLFAYLNFKDNRLSRVVIPKRFVTAFSADLLIGVVKAMGDSQVSAFRGILSAAWSEDLGPLNAPTQSKVESTLGVANEYEKLPDGLVATYRYKLILPEDADPDDATERWIKVVYDSETNQVTQVMSRSIRFYFKPGESPL